MSIIFLNYLIFLLILYSELSIYAYEAVFYSK